jgi:hypothetical protein
MSRNCKAISIGSIRSSDCLGVHVCVTRDSGLRTRSDDTVTTVRLLGRVGTALPASSANYAGTSQAVCCFAAVCGETRPTLHGRHGQTRTNTDNHGQTQTNTDKHGQAGQFYSLQRPRTAHYPLITAWLVQAYELANCASNAILLRSKSIFLTNSTDSRAPWKRSIRESSHSTDRGPV